MMNETFVTLARAEGDAPLCFSADDPERDARLLEVGDYPDKNLTLTEADLDALAANFSGPVPVKVEHINSPLDPLGQVRRVWRAGRFLMGRVAFPPEMAAFLHKRGVQKLSCGLRAAPAWRLLEASLVLHPHIPSATLLSDESKDAEIGRLRAALRRQTVDAQLAGFRAAGQVVPATEPLARVLLAADEGATVTLSDGQSRTVAQTFASFLAALPPLVSFAELAPAPSVVGVSDAAGLSAADRAWLRDTLGVDFAAPDTREGPSHAH